MRAWFSFQLLMALLVAGCAFGGISRDRATELALQAGGDSTIPATVVSIESGPLGRFADALTLAGERHDRQVWAVVLAGNFAGECVMSADGESVCPPGATRKLVVLDFATGSIVFTQSP